MSEAKEAATPADPGLKLEKSSEAEKSLDQPYAEAVGSLMYAATCTRPDIAFATGRVAQFMSKPGQQHWIAVKRILRYLKGIASLGDRLRRHHRCPRRVLRRGLRW